MHEKMTCLKSNEERKREKERESEREREMICIEDMIPAE
jgi:hypothetical protein